MKDSISDKKEESSELKRTKSKLSSSMKLDEITPYSTGITNDTHSCDTEGNRSGSKKRSGSRKTSPSTKRYESNKRSESRKRSVSRKRSRSRRRSRSKKRSKSRKRSRYRKRSNPDKRQKARTMPRYKRCVSKGCLENTSWARDIDETSNECVSPTDGTNKNLNNIKISSLIN